MTEGLNLNDWFLSALCRQGLGMIDVNPQAGTTMVRFTSGWTAAKLGPEHPLLLAAKHAKLGRLFVCTHSRSSSDGILVYVVALTPGGAAGDATAAIGGDRYMAGARLEDAIERATSLAYGMAEKSATAASQVPECLRGKKSVFFIVSNTGAPKQPEPAEVEEMYAAAIMEVLPIINQRLLGDRAAMHKGLMPVTASPDVWTGQHWNTICTKLGERGFDKRLFTCHPASMSGFTFPSARPTAAGVDEAVRQYAHHLSLEVASQKYLIEGGGSCTEYQVGFLLDQGVPRNAISIIEPNSERLAALRSKFKEVQLLPGPNAEVIPTLRNSFDVLIVNGLGDQLTRAMIERVIGCGVRMILGCANSLFRLSEEEQISDLCADHDVLATPSATQNFGGWLSALVGCLATAAQLPLREAQESVEKTVRATERQICGDILQLASRHSIGYYAAGQRLIQERLWCAGEQQIEGTMRSAAEILRALTGVNAPVSDGHNGVVVRTRSACPTSMAAGRPYGFDECGFFYLGTEG